MTQPRNARPTVYPSFPAGINNTASEEAMPRDQWGNVVALRDAVNVDITPDGKPQRRQGYTRTVQGSDVHSAWSDDYLPFGLFVDGARLCVMHADESVETLREGLSLGLPVSYTRVNDAVWWSNGQQSGIVTAGLAQMPWSAGEPPGAPMLTAVSGQGTLPRGTYQVTVTFLDAAGRESGAPRAAVVDVPDNGAILVQHIPQPPYGGRVRLYASQGQDGDLRAAVTLDAGIDEYLLRAPAEGRRCDTLLLRTMPPGQLVAHGNGRLFVARGREVFFSPALRYGLVHPSAGRVGFVGRVQMMAFVGDGTDGAGLYVSDTKRVYWLAGADPKNWSQVIAYSTPALPGHIAWVPGSVFGLQTDNLLPCWHSRDGRLCVGTPGGQVVTPQPREGMPDAAWDTGDAAALHYIERPGDRRLLSAVRGASPSNLAVTDTLVVHEYRHP